MKAFLAEAMALTGNIDNALELIDETIAQIERPGWEERLVYAEILRLKGWLLSLKGDVADAERSYFASLDWARRQQAKSWELRTATSLARLWQSQGKRQKAYGLLAPVYDWFTEGFDTRDLQEAKSLLAELRLGTEHILLALADVASASRPGRPAGMYHKPWDAVGEVGVGRLFPEMTPRQPAPTFGLKVRFTDDPGVWRQIG